jgi:hypothetical protein
MSKYVVEDRDYRVFMKRIETVSTLEEMRIILRDLITYLNYQDIPEER